MNPLSFRSIQIRRMPGIRHPFAVKDLARGVNIIYGPNASGKSTTARAIEILLWPGEAGSRSEWLEGQLQSTTDSWSVDLQLDRLRYERNGIESGPLHLPAAADRDRYLLALHDLLRADDAAFAQAIAHESAGGYDLTAAARILAPRRSRSRPVNEQKALTTARSRLQSAIRAQTEIEQRARTLAEDEAELDRRPILEERKRLLEEIEDYLQLRVSSEGDLRDLQRFHPVLARLTGNEAEHWSELRSKLRENEVSEHGARREAERLQVEIDRLSLPPALLEGDSLAVLSAASEEIEKLEEEIRTQTGLVAQARTNLQQAQRRLGPGIEPEKFATIRDELRPELAARIGELVQVRAQRVESEAELDALEGDPAGIAESDAGGIEQGRTLLLEWLSSPPAAAAGNRREWLLAGTGAALLLVGGVAMGFIHPAGFLLSLAGGGLLLMLLLMRTPSAASGRAAVEKRYAALELIQAPEQWEEREVRKCLNHLELLIARIRDATSRRERAARVEAKLRGHRTQESELLHMISTFAEQGGYPVHQNEIDFFRFIEHLAAWQNAHDSLAGAQQALTVAREIRAQAFERTNQQLLAINQPAMTDLAGLRGRISHLGSAIQSHARLALELRMQLSAAQQSRESIERCEAERSKLLERLGIEPEEGDRLAEWCAERPEFLKVKKRRDLSEGMRAHSEELLLRRAGAEPGMLEAEPGHFTLEIRQIEEALVELQATYDRVLALRTEIDKAKQNHDIEDALAAEEQCVEALRRVRERDIQAAVAQVLIEHLERTESNDHLPQVFHRASALFTRITQGAYELDFDSDQGGAFRALETITQQRLPLEHLSSATRVQLLIAVRLAFIEMQESTVRLPLVMDETLANSDDRRTEAILEAVLTLAGEGRQIFYFTAQPDEVAKWAAALAARPEVQSTIIDLAEVRSLEGRLAPEHLAARKSLDRPLPDPSGHSHRSYGELLLVPPPEVHEPVGALHLWYLVEDPVLLYQLLERLRNDRWAHLQSVIERGGVALVEREVHEKLNSLAEVAQTALTKLRIGRGKRVDRSVLLESDAVSDRFIDEVDELCTSLGGDAAALLYRIEQGAVANFRRDRTAALREYLDASGHLDTRERLAPNQIWPELLAIAMSAPHHERITPEQAEDLFERLLRALQGSSLERLELLPTP